MSISGYISESSKKLACQPFLLFAIVARGSLTYGLSRQPGEEGFRLLPAISQNSGAKSVSSEETRRWFLAGAVVHWHGINAARLYHQYVPRATG